MLVCHSLSALELADQNAIKDVIAAYTEAWNLHTGKGFGYGFTEDADFVNILGMHFSGKQEIEARHVQILQSFLKGTTLSISSTSLREAQPGVVIAIVRWKLDGYATVSPDSHLPDIQEGVFTQVFIHTGKKWEIKASQNTLVPIVPSK